jgi:hypothetical protein
MGTGPEFPADWGSNCPPADAELAGGTVYRTTKQDPPAEEDFKTWFELGKVSPRSSKPQICRTRALSVFREIADARIHMEKYPWENYKFVAKADLTSTCGKTKPVPIPEMPTHTEFWCAEGVSRLALFSVV